MRRVDLGTAVVFAALSVYWASQGEAWSAFFCGFVSVTALMLSVERR